MVKSYKDFMDELTPDMIYEGLLAHGLFCEKLPPVFDSSAFFSILPEHDNYIRR